MHLLARETRSLDEDDAARDLGQSAADLVFLSFSDSDIGAVAMAWQQGKDDLPSLRLANLGELRHPMSVDLYVEGVVAHARCVVVRLLGGIDYWRYGFQEVFAACRQKRIPLAFLPGDAQEDARLREHSTIDAEAWDRLDGFFRHGGPANLTNALKLMAHLAGLGVDDKAAPAELPKAGLYDLKSADGAGDGRPRAVIVFYRAYLAAGDVAPIDALAEALERHDFEVRAIYVSSLKDSECADYVAARLAAWRPPVILNATAFSARPPDGGASPLEAAGAPVLQVVTAGCTEDAWNLSSRGVSQADLAMQVVLPELDGRLLTTAVSFKAPSPAIPDLESAPAIHRPHADGITLAAARAAGWARLGQAPRATRRLAIILSDYPGAGGQLAHAVGLDAIASTVDVIALLRAEGYSTGGDTPDHDALIAGLCNDKPTDFISIAHYRRLFDTFPAAIREKVSSAWGEPEDDPSAEAGMFRLRHRMFGNIVVAIQPDRGVGLDRKATYHDPDSPPRHGYIAFYLWLREIWAAHALIHLGTHGTLEWLPGKAAAISDTCFARQLIAGLPVLYPFIVNNPGEAAAAKRRLGAVTIGHLTPPLKSAGSHGAAMEIERLIDEYAAADGLDRRRTVLLRREILDRAQASGLLGESGANAAPSDDEALARLDAYLCDVKDLQIRDGLHIFGRAPGPERRVHLIDALRRSSPATDPERLVRDLDRSPQAERQALLAGLDARFVAPGPAGAPTRGRTDVLPTGRNLFAVDSRAVPTRSAVALAEKAADVFLRRHLQDHGDWPRSLVIDLWASTTIRTGGEDIALALILMGARPAWDEGSARVGGIEILPLAEIDRPRIDVTLRISGLFRDAFETQIRLLDGAVRAIAARDEPPDLNPLAASIHGLEGTARQRATTRIFGAAPGSFGAGLTERIEVGAWRDAAELAQDYLQSSGYAYGADQDGVRDEAGFANRVREADAFVHAQDHAEVDLLESLDYAAYEGGFAAAARYLENAPALYHLDVARPDAPKARTVAETVARVVRGRAANPAWIAGMIPHGYRGAAEITRTVEALFAFAATLPDRLDRQFDLLFDATLGDSRIDAFLRDQNPAGREAMRARFLEAVRRGLWQPRRNSAAASLEEQP